MKYYDCRRLENRLEDHVDWSVPGVRYLRRAIHVAREYSLSKPLLVTEMSLVDLECETGGVLAIAPRAISEIPHKEKKFHISWYESRCQYLQKYFCY